MLLRVVWEEGFVFIYLYYKLGTRGALCVWLINVERMVFKVDVVYIYLFFSILYYTVECLYALFMSDTWHFTERVIHHLHTYTHKGYIQTWLSGVSQDDCVYIHNYTITTPHILMANVMMTQYILTRRWTRNLSPSYTYLIVSGAVIPIIYKYIGTNGILFDTIEGD